MFMSTLVLFASLATAVKLNSVLNANTSPDHDTDGQCVSEDVTNLLQSFVTVHSPLSQQRELQVCEGTACRERHKPSSDVPGKTLFANMVNRVTKTIVFNDSNQTHLTSNMTINKAKKNKRRNWLGDRLKKKKKEKEKKEKKEAKEKKENSTATDSINEVIKGQGLREDTNTKYDTYVTIQALGAAMALAFFISIIFG